MTKILGPSWQPKLGVLFGGIAILLHKYPVGGWAGLPDLFQLLGIYFGGWNVRQDNVTSEQAGAAKPTFVPNVPLILLLGFLVFSSGCAVSRPTFRTETRGTNGVVEIRELRVSTYALWPATQEIAKQRASLGKTFAFGSEALTQETGSTNIIESLRALSDLVGKLKP